MRTVVLIIVGCAVLNMAILLALGIPSWGGWLYPAMLTAVIAFLHLRDYFNRRRA